MLSACALNANYTDSIDQLNDFDLCFPESGRISIMEINEKIAIQKAIIEEKAKRNLTCDGYSNFVSGEENLKSILVMTITPLVAKRIGLNNPKSAMVFGGLMGTNSGVAAGLAAVDPKLVPYGAMTATFYTAVGCLIVPSILFFLVDLLF